MPGRKVRTPTWEDVERATRLVRAHLPSTPVVTTDVVPGGLLKLETAQPTGSFKVRGALAALAAMPGDRRAVAASAGNHGLGVAFAAERLDVDATVVVSEHASSAKVEQLARWPVTLVRHGDGYDAAEAHALTMAAADDAVFVSGYNDPQVIAGSGSIGAELDDQLGGPLTVVVPLGGGGLASGLALWAARRGDVGLVCVEAAQSTATSTALREGRISPVEVGPTVADGLAGNLEAGSVTVDILRSAGVHTVAVTETEIGAAVRWLFSRHGLVSEGSGAVGVAAALAGRLDVNDPTRPTVFVVTGRNVAADVYAGLLVDGNGEWGDRR